MGDPVKEQAETLAALRQVVDAARLVTAILRAERFTDGVIAQTLESGVLLAVADRILAGLGGP